MGLLSSIVDAGASIYASNKSAKSAKNINQAQMAYSRELAQNAHQWEVEDLKKAGINPIATANGGQGASTFTPSAQMPDYSSLKGMGKNINDILNSAKQIENETKVATAQEENLNADTANKQEENKYIGKKALTEIGKNDTESAKNTAETKLKQKEGELITQEIVEKELDNAILEIEKEVNTGNYGKALAYIDRTLNTLKGVSGVAGAVLTPFIALKGAKTAKEMKDAINTYRANKSSHTIKSHRSYK